MSNRRRNNLIFLVVLLVTLAVIGRLKRANPTTEAAEATPAPTATRTPSPTPLPGASRSDPVPLRSSGAVPNFSFIVTSVTWPADDVVARGNMFNPDAGAGREYLMVEMTVSCRAEDCYFAPGNFGVVGERGVVYEPEYVVADGALESAELLQGGRLRGALFFIVPESENGLVLRWSPLVGDELWLSLE